MMKTVLTSYVPQRVRRRRHLVLLGGPGALGARRLGAGTRRREAGEAALGDGDVPPADEAVTASAEEKLFMD